MLLRKFGMICRKTEPVKQRLRISKTLMPGGYDIIHDRAVYTAPTNTNDLESQIHVFNELKNTTKSK